MTDHIGGSISGKKERSADDERKGFLRKRTEEKDPAPHGHVRRHCVALRIGGLLSVGAYRLYLWGLLGHRDLDTIGSVLVSVYMIWCGIRTIRENRK